MTMILSCGCTIEGASEGRVYDVEYEEDIFNRSFDRDGKPKGYTRGTVYATWCKDCIAKIGPKLDSFAVVRAWGDD